MNTNQLKKFAQAARRTLMEQVSAQLSIVLAEGSLARRESFGAVTELEREIRDHGKHATIEKAAYTWFNRFTALMYMDAIGLTAVRTTLPEDGETVPHILSYAKAGEFDDSVLDKTRQRVTGLLDGDISSRDPEGEAYRLLLVAECNHWHRVMPFMFERIADWTELLMPADLLSNTSVLAQMREVMTEEACRDVEIIGWLYQFYISEKKDQVFAGLKKNQKITTENIPAATQLFTPHWIVRYLVENSLGRLWLLNRPESRLAERMDYYIAPEEPETDFLKITRPEEIRICDPAAGSGHMLTYAFDLLYAIYEEEGYEASEIPALILTHNLTGVEIDDRAGALAAFALMMKAAARLGRRRFLRMAAKPDICVLQNVAFTPAEMKDVAAVVSKDLFTEELRETLGQFEQAKNFGSLIMPKLRDPAETLRVVEARDFGGDLLLKEVQERVIAVLRMAEALSPKYHVVVANPPYMSASGMNATLKGWLKTNFPTSKADAMTAFMERSAKLAASGGYWGMINLPSWLFLGTYEKLRLSLLENNTVNSLLHLGRGIFGSDFGSVAFTLRAAKPKTDDRAVYRKLFENHVDVRDVTEISRIFLDSKYGHFDVEQAALLRIPGAPIAYWISDRVGEIFADFPKMIEVASVCAGHQTGENEKFLRQWQEISADRFSTDTTSRSAAKSSKKTWFPHNKGGEFRRWYGNRDLVINWRNDGAEIRAHPSSALRNPDQMFLEGVSWSHTTSGSFGARFSPEGSTFNVEGPTLFHAQPKAMLALLSSKAALELIHAMGHTVHFLVGTVSAIPVLTDAAVISEADKIGSQLVAIGQSDWDAYETSWDFTTLPLLSPEHRSETLEDSYATLRAYWQSMTDEMQRLEEENNRIFIDAYGLQDELTPEVPIEEITLTCNPAYSIKGDKTDEQREIELRRRTIEEFISYAVGCMFGRYSLDAPGLILANQGERLEDYLARVPSPAFMPDKDNVIPVLDDVWFDDDITERFRQFLTVTFGKERFTENLAFIEDALGKDIRKYFLRDFYKDHVKRYKKRPIYWMFSSPKGSFNALIYMHRYRPDTASVILNDYLREFRSKITVARKECERVEASADASQREKVRAGKDRMHYDEILLEIDSWEKDVLFPLATQNITIDLDDGVKANYPKFGDALARIPGLEAKDE